MSQPHSHSLKPYSCKFINLIIKSKHEHQYNFGSSTNMPLRVQQDHNPSIFIIPHTNSSIFNENEDININLDFFLASACP
jgi:hypothetical protein